MHVISNCREKCKMSMITFTVEELLTFNKVTRPLRIDIRLGPP